MSSLHPLMQAMAAAPSSAASAAAPAAEPVIQEVKQEMDTKDLQPVADLPSTPMLVVEDEKQQSGEAIGSAVADKDVAEQAVLEGVAKQAVGEAVGVAEAAPDPALHQKFLQFMKYHSKTPTSKKYKDVVNLAEVYGRADVNHKRAIIKKWAGQGGSKGDIRILAS